MKFGLVGFPIGQLQRYVEAPPAQVVTAIARDADEAGFEFVCAQDHILAPREWATERGGETWFDPFVVLGWAAAVTTRIKLVTDVLVAPYRSPFQVAKTMGSLDVMSDGRAVCGVAAGYLEREFRILGAEFERRGALTDEWIEALKVAWDADWFDFDGEFFHAKDVAVSPRPESRPPIWVGGNSARALRRAVEHADGWTPFRGSPSHVAEMLSRHTLPKGFTVVMPLRHGVYTSDHTAIDADSVRRQADEYAAAGVTHMKVGFRGPALDDYRRALTQFATDVIARA